MLAAIPIRRLYKPTLHGYAVLGALTPEQATETVFPAASVRSGAGHSVGVRAGIVSVVQSGQLTPSYIPGSKDCAKAAASTGLSNVQLAQIGGGLALTGINIAAATSGAVSAAVGAALGPATQGISAIIALFPLLFGHHTAAVKREQSVLCAAVPAAQNYLQLIDQAVQKGQATPQQAIQALQSLQSDFESAVSSIRKGTGPGDSGGCNAACVMVAELGAIVAYKSSVYQDLANAQASAAPPATGGSGPTTAAPVASGSTMMIPAPAPAGYQPAIAFTTPAGVAPASRAAPASALSQLQSALPSWWPIAALAFFGLLAIKEL